MINRYALFTPYYNFEFKRMQLFLLPTHVPITKDTYLIYIQNTV